MDFFVVVVVVGAQDDDEAVKEYGVQLGVRMCKYLLAHGVRGLHFYTLNLEKTVSQILEGLDLIPRDQRKRLPWKPVSWNVVQGLQP